MGGESKDVCVDESGTSGHAAQWDNREGTLNHLFSFVAMDDRGHAIQSIPGALLQRHNTVI